MLPGGVPELNPVLTNVLNYLAWVLYQGDWKNDWLTHLTDPRLRMLMGFIGRLLAWVIGN